MSKSYFCWVRLLDARTAVRKAPVTYFHGDLLEEKSGVHIFYGDRPPGITAETNTDSVVPVWAAVPEVFGREGATTVFDYGPAFNSRQEALDWLSCPAGQCWDEDALNRFLMSLTAAIPLGTKQPKHEPCQGTFLDTDWHEQFKFKHLRKPKVPLFDPSRLRLKDPQEYATVADECALLRDLATEERPAAKGDIDDEAHSPTAAAWPVFKAAGLAFEGPPATKRSLALAALRETVIDAIEPSIYHFKRYFCRGRPLRQCRGLDVMFDKVELKNFPGHPAFPSGHATVAHVFAGLIAARQPHLAQAVETEAAAVARRREIAGLHYQSDSAAGKDLAQQMVKQMLDPALNPSWDEFERLLKALDP